MRVWLEASLHVRFKNAQLLQKQMPSLSNGNVSFTRTLPRMSGRDRDMAVDAVGCGVGDGASALPRVAVVGVCVFSAGPALHAG